MTAIRLDELKEVLSLPNLWDVITHGDQEPRVETEGGGGVTEREGSDSGPEGTDSDGTPSLSLSRACSLDHCKPL